MDRTHFADEATLKHIATLENRVQLLVKALRDARDKLNMCAFIMSNAPSEQVLKEQLNWSEQRCKSFVQAWEAGETCVEKIDTALREVGLDISEKKAD